MFSDSKFSARKALLKKSLNDKTFWCQSIQRNIQYIIQMRNSLCVPVFAWKLGLICSSTQVPKWVSHVQDVSWKNLEKQILKTHSGLNFLDILSIYRR